MLWAKGGDDRVVIRPAPFSEYPGKAKDPTGTSGFDLNYSSTLLGMPFGFPIGIIQDRLRRRRKQLSAACAPDASDRQQMSDSELDIPASNSSAFSGRLTPARWKMTSACGQRLLRIFAGRIQDRLPYAVLLRAFKRNNQVIADKTLRTRYQYVHEHHVFPIDPSSSIEPRHNSAILYGIWTIVHLQKQFDHLLEPTPVLCEL